MANPFLDAESAELRLNFVHDSIARNGVALLVRKTPAKIRLNKDMLLKMLDEHKEGIKNNARKIYTIYSFLIWYDVTRSS